MPEAGSERTLRDLMGLLALPALWVGKDGLTVLQIVTEAIERIVPLAMCYLDVPLVPGAAPTKRLRVNGSEVSTADLKAWEASIAALHQVRIAAASVPVDTPLGRLQVMRLSMGYSSRDGSIWFGSADQTFPQAPEIAFLRAAATLAATGLQSARAMREREQANRAKDEFLAMLGHELRNPLAPIVTSLELIKRRNVGPLGREHAVIERQVNHLRRLVDDLLDVSRITGGKIELHKEALPIQSILFRAIEASSPLIEQRRHELTVDLPDGGPWVLGDATRLTQVFANLLTNAAKYTDPGGKLRVRACVEDDRVSVHVEDNGVGISPDLRERLFTIFEQGRRTIDRASGGLGIGLAISKTFVSLHGGTITAESAGDGCGTKVIVCLPTMPEPAFQAGATITEPFPDGGIPEAAGMRILLVDDNRDAVGALRAGLEQLRFTVALAHGADEALALADTFKPHVAVLDIGLPGMNGYELAARLLQRLPAPRPRLVALSGYGQESDRSESLKAGFAHHLVKPVGMEELVAAILQNG